jgi:AcrR family transcriptional regulator
MPDARPREDRHRVVLSSVAAPKQARSEETLYRILDAAEALISEKGLADASIPEIVRRAGSSVGGFYARFRDKNELLRTLEERFFNELSQRVDALSDPEQWTGACVPDIARSLVAELVGTFRERQALIAVFTVRASHDPEFVADSLRFRQSVSRRIVALIMTRADEIAHPEPALAIDFCVQLAFSLMHQVVVFGEVCADERTLSDARLEQEITRNFLAYLGVECEPTRTATSAHRSES